MIRAERRSPVITQMEQCDPGKSARLVKCSWETLGQEKGNLPHTRQSLTFGMVVGVCVWGSLGCLSWAQRERKASFQVAPTALGFLGFWKGAGDGKMSAEATHCI